MIRARDDEGGQALAIAAAGAFVLAVALALTIDWGYALVQRRIAQNDADKIAMEVGRLLTTSVGLSGNTPIFTVAGRDPTVRRQKALTHVEACASAVSAYQRDRSTPATSPAIWLDFEQWAGSSSSSDAPTSYVRANCAPGKAKTVAVDGRTTTVRVRVEFRYKPIFASLLRQPAVVVGATSRVALTGAPYTVDAVDRDAVDAQASVSQSDYADLAQSASAIVRTWPLVRRYNVSELANKRPCGPACDPTTATPLDFPISNGRFSDQGMVRVLDLSGQSSRSPGLEQLITRAESASSVFVDGFEQGFGGVLGLETDWAPPLQLAGQDKVPSLTVKPDRYSCRNVPAWLLPPPSCTETTPDQRSTRGDWIETIPAAASGDVAGAMRVLIDSKGTTTPYSSKPMSGNGGPTFGKALVVWIYLWDCGQRFQNGQWTAYTSGDDCRSETERVHLFSAIPVTFYSGLVTTNSIKGYWGGNFVEAGRCQAAPGSCPALAPLANSAFLVADDQRWDPTDDGVSEDQDDGDQCEGGQGDNCDGGNGDTGN